MSNFSKTKVPVAMRGKTHLDLSFDHVTTSSFLRLQPLGYIHMIPGQSIDINSIVNIRPAPMPVPTYGNMSMHLRYFFVPYRLAFPKWDSFKQDVISSNLTNSAIPIKPPYFLSDDIYQLFTLPAFGMSVVGSSTDFDFSAGGSYYKFTRFGRFAYKNFYSLGYDIVGYDNKDALEFNGLALLAWARIYVDWFANSQYMDSSDITGLMQLLEYNDPSTALHLIAQHLYLILNLSYIVNYTSNPYFEDAWDNPASPSNNQFTSFSFQDIDSSNIVRAGSNMPYMEQASSTSVNIGSSYLHSALDKLTSYMQRHAISGAREIDRFLSEAGFVSDYLRVMRSIYCGSNIIDINVGDIYATATSSNSSGASELGDYAGRAFGAGQKPCSFTASEHGIFIIAASIIPSGGYYQGYDRHNRHIDKLDFFDGKLDGLSTQVMEKGEVYVSRNNDNFINAPSDYATKFGYIKRYGEYKRSINRVSGDIALPNFIAGGDSWHLMREFKDLSFLGNVSNISHNRDFSRGIDNGLFNRIFNYQYSEYDNFYVFAHFSISSYSPCQPLFDVFEFDEDASKEITMSVNGSKLN